MNQKVYIVTSYYRNIPPAPNQKILYVFKLNDSWCCICECELEWGKPRISVPIEEQYDYTYHYFKTYDKAFEFVRLLKELNR